MEIADPNLSLRRRRKGASNRSTSGNSRSPVPLEGDRSVEAAGGRNGLSEGDGGGQTQASTPPPPFHLPPAAANLPQPPPTSSSTRGHEPSSSQHVSSSSSSSSSSSQEQQRQESPPESPPKPVRDPPPSNGPPSPKPPRTAPPPVEAAAAPPAPPTPAVVRSSVAQWSGVGSEDSANNCWSEAPSNVFQVRGPKYLSDKKKVASAPCLYATIGLDVLFNNENAAPSKVKERASWARFLQNHERWWIPGRVMGDIISRLLSSSFVCTCVHMYSEQRGNERAASARRSSGLLFGETRRVGQSSFRNCPQLPHALGLVRDLPGAENYGFAFTSRRRSSGIHSSFILLESSLLFYFC